MQYRKWRKWRGWRYLTHRIQWFIVRGFTYGPRYWFDAEYREKIFRKLYNQHKKRKAIEKMGVTGYNKYKQVRWKGKRKLMGDARKGQCNICKFYFPREKLTVDHIVKNADGGSNKLVNLQLLCRPCHELKDNPPYREKNKEVFTNTPFKAAFEKEKQNPSVRRG